MYEIYIRFTVVRNMWNIMEKKQHIINMHKRRWLVYANKWVCKVIY